MDFWKVVFKDENGRETYYTAADSVNMRSLTYTLNEFMVIYPNVKKFDLVRVTCSHGDRMIESTPLSYDLDQAN